MDIAEVRQNGESFDQFDMVGKLLTDTLIPIVIIVCIFVAFAALIAALKAPAQKSTRYFTFASGSYLFSLALPFLAFPLQLVFDAFDRTTVHVALKVLVTIALVGGTYFLVKGTRQLRLEASAA